MKHDLNGDGKAEILVTSPWGLGVLNLTASGLQPHTMAPNGIRFGQWLLNTGDNNVEMKGDFDGDGRGEMLMSSPWGIGILKLINGNLTSIAMASNGTRRGGWIVNTIDNQFLFADDFNNDGRDEILVTSPWGLGILKYENFNFTSLMLMPNGTRFGQWLLNTADNFFTLTGDFDGDKKSEILVTSPWGIGILKFNGTTLNSVVMAANGTHLGNWTVNTQTDKFEVAGDFDGDGKLEILVSNNDKIGILKMQGNTLVTVCTASDGSKLGSWTLDSKKNKMNTVGDFDADGKTEILISSDWGIGVLKLSGNKLTTTIAKPNGTRFNEWLLNTKDNRLNYAADFDKDGKAEIQISSPWGIGILKQSGSTFTAITMAPNGTRFGGWLLNTADNDLETGLGQSYGLIIYHSQWQWAVTNTTSHLRNRGYTMYVTPNGADGINLLKRLSRHLKASDRLFVYIAGHGGSNRTLGDTQKAVSLTHILQFEDGALIGYDQFVPSFQLMGNKGVDVAVFDGSCDGGESVLNAIGERFLAMSTTSVYAPGLTNTPDPSDVMKLFGKPNKFGMWWSPYYAASLLTSKTPHRFYQKIYRNDDTPINTWSLFYKPAITFYTALGSGWDLMVRHCYLYRYIYPADYNALSQADKDLMTGSTNDFLASMRADYNALAPSIVQLKQILQNAATVDKAASVYADAYPRPWQTVFGDMAWDVSADPAKHSSQNNALIPGSYTGKTGFKKMVNETLNLIALLEQVYNRQEALLVQIDAEIIRKKIFKGVFKVQAVKAKAITDYLKFNEYDEQKNLRYQNILNTVNVNRTSLFEELRKPAESLQRQKTFDKLIDMNISAIKPHLKEIAFELPSLDDLIAELKSISIESSVYLDKLFYLLIIVEEAVSRIQATSVEDGELVSF